MMGYFMVVVQTKQKHAAVILCEMVAVSIENRDLFSLLQGENGLL